MSKSLTHKGTLLLGVEFDGKTHKEFEIRLAKVSDSIDAEKETSGKSGVEFMVAVISRQLVSLGDIPKKSITTELLRDMYDDDLTILQNAKESLKKKLMEPVSEQKHSD